MTTDIKFRRATIEDFNDIWRLLTHARSLMRKHNNIQWDGLTKAFIKNEIAREEYYLVIRGGETVACFALSHNHDTSNEDNFTYSGTQCTQPNIEIGRLALAKFDLGLVRVIFDYVVSLCPNIVIDTGENNIAIQKMCLRLGFTKIGEWTPRKYTKSGTRALKWYVYEYTNEARATQKEAR
ncbi:MAG: hypothetical protein LBM01_02415 [Christensenellaceae bacterium]|nr:hypothetical protein [Christensenellaceae bacterium]